MKKLKPLQRYGSRERGRRGRRRPRRRVVTSKALACTSSGAPTSCGGSKWTVASGNLCWLGQPRVFVMDISICKICERSASSASQTLGLAQKWVRSAVIAAH